MTYACGSIDRMNAPALRSSRIVCVVCQHHAPICAALLWVFAVCASSAFAQSSPPISTIGVISQRPGTALYCPASLAGATLPRSKPRDP